MTRFRIARIAPALLAPLALAACATPAYVSPVEVTRFVGQAPEMPLAGPVTLAPASGVDTGSIEYPIFEAAVASELEGHGFTIAGEDAPLVAVVRIGQAVRQAGHGRRSPVSVGGSASTGSFGSGVGIGVGINLNSLGGPPPDEIDTVLSVSIRPTTGGMALWEGRALMTATSNSDYADSAEAAARVAGALFQDFPGNDGETIEIE